MACNHKYGAAYPDSSQSSGYARMCGLCGDIIEANEGDTCDHNWVATENVGFSSGYGYVCTMCGELGEELDPQPSHSHDWQSDGTVSPTCTESGYTNYVCNCGETRKDDYTPALGHNWVAESNGGFSSGYGYVCSRCGELGEELECTHSYSSEVDGSRVHPTCTEAGYVSYICDDCGHIWQESLPALGHDWGEPFYSNEFSSGYGQKCNRCGDLQECTPPYEPDEPDEPDEPTPPAPHTHTWQKGTTVAPTCTAAGYTYYYCSCGGSKTGDTTPALGHAYGAPYFSDEFSSGYGKKCVRCGDLVELDPPVTECQHEFEFSKTVAATCEAEGYDLYICSKCGAQEQRNKTSALGHTAGAWVEDKAATCTAKGSRHQVCAVCGKTIKTEEIPALGHKWVAEENDGFSSGYGYVCANCGELGEELTKPDDGGDTGGETEDEDLLIKKSTLTAIADAVREKTGGAEPMTAAEIPNNIRNMRAAKPADTLTDSTALSIKPVPADAAPYAEVVEIGGRTQKWNQLLKLTAPYSTTQNGVTLTINDNGSITLNGQATSRISFGVIPALNIPVVSGHKYYMECGSSTFHVNWALSSEESDDIRIATATQTLTASVQIDIFETTTVFNNKTFFPKIVDLTEIYGAGNEPTTVQDCHITRGYEPYDEGSLRSAPVTEVESVGVNLFDINAPHTVSSGGTYNYSLYGKPNTKYTFSTNVPQSNPANIYANGGDTSGYGIYEGRSKTTTTDENGKMYCEVRYRASGTGIDVYTGLLNGTYYLMVNEGTTVQPYTPYFRHTLPIPEAVRNLDGYGEGNPDNAEEYNAIICKDGKWKYSHKGDIDNNVWTPLATPIITDISDLLPADNLIGVEAGGTVTMVNEYGYDVPNTVTFYEGKNEVVGADTFVGDLHGTAARAMADGEGKQLATREWVLEQLAALMSGGE